VEEVEIVSYNYQLLVLSLLKVTIT